MAQLGRTIINGHLIKKYSQATAGSNGDFHIDVTNDNMPNITLEEGMTINVSFPSATDGSIEAKEFIEE